MNLDKKYSPEQIEEKWYKFWVENSYFHGKPNKEKKKFSVVIPPPNVTGILHMGHVLNNVIQDIFVRYHRMLGEETMWLPGTDHAGIATQNVVEKELAKEGKKKEDLGREAFVEKVQQWKEEKGGTIIRQLKKIGASCDWDRERYTMDEHFDKAVKTVFVKLYEKGLIYRDKYIINWCPRCETALSDDEVEHEEHNGHLWYIKYPIKGEDDFVVVATTRPETMLGDTAVAVNPKDERYSHLVGKKLLLPLTNREIPVIADEFVDPSFGTGCVKVTPAHDPNDFEMGERHNLPKIVIMDENAMMTKEAGVDYEGMDRYEAREKVLMDLQDRKLLLKEEEHKHSVGHCYRCNTTIEPYLSTQWFVKMKPLAEPAIDVVRKGEVKFYPARWTKVYYNWMENIRDWCISRQLWWGHRIPVWYCDDCGHQFTSLEKNVKKCPKCGSSNIHQDENVLDTWFSSWLWSFATLGWPEKTEDLEYFHPTDLLVTAPGIIFFWVARMIMSSLEFMKEIPFHSVYLHGMVLDEKGRKMSKSLGNSPDPIDIVKEYGADALRFSMIFNTPIGESVIYSNSLIEIGRNFANKIWNAARYLIMNLEDFDPNSIKEDELNLEIADKWILHQVNQKAKEIAEYFAAYRLNEVAHTLYEFFWHDFCDWYLEFTKIRLYDKENTTNTNTAKYVLWKVLNTSLRFLHPFMPFISEELWHNLPHKKDESEALIIADYPIYDENVNYAEEADFMNILKEIITKTRNIKAEMNIPLKQEIKLVVKTKLSHIQKALKESFPYFKFFLKCNEIDIVDDIERPKNSAVIVLKDIEIYIPLEGLIDIEVERNKFEKELAQLEKHLQQVINKLNNEKFISKAPEHIVAKEKEKKAYLEDKIAKIKANLELLDK